MLDLPKGTKKPHHHHQHTPGYSRSCSGREKEKKVDGSKDTDDRERHECTFLVCAAADDDDDDDGPSFIHILTLDADVPHTQAAAARGDGTKLKCFPPFR